MALREPELPQAHQQPAGGQHAGTIDPASSRLLRLLGGDEFAVLLVDIEEQNTCVVSDRILRAFAEPYPAPRESYAASMRRT